MSLDIAKPILEQGILELQKEMMQKDANAMEHFANRLAGLIYEFVKSGELEINEGIAVSTSGSSGTTIGKGTGKIK